MIRKSAFLGAVALTTLALADVSRDNVDGGARHLRMLLDRYGGNLPLTLAAYNAGQGRVEAAGGVPDITETREYVFKVLRYRKQYLESEGGGVLQARR